MGKHEKSKISHTAPLHNNPSAPADVKKNKEIKMGIWYSQSPIIITTSTIISISQALQDIMEFYFKVFSYLRLDCQWQFTELINHTKYKMKHQYILNTWLLPQERLPSRVS